MAVALNTSTATTLTNAIPEHWASKVRHDAIQQAFWSPFEGKEGAGMPILTKDDLTKLPGDTIHIQTISRLGGTGVTGETTLAGSEEQLSLGQFDLTVDWLRHAVAFTKKATKQANFDAVMAAGRLLSQWLARFLDDNAFSTLISNVTNTIYANDATSDATLGTNDTFGTTEIDRIRLALIRQGAIPIMTIKDGKQARPVYGVVISEMDEYNLGADTVWVQAQENAAIRGSKNPLFSMALGMYKGMLIYTHYGLSGYQGTPLRPEASLYGAHLSTETTTITVGVNTNRDYTKHFPSSGTIKIRRASDGEEEFVSYSATTNNTFTITSRGATYGGATPNAALDLVAGDIVTNLNHNSHVIGFGAEIAARSWGAHPIPIHQEEDYGFEKGIGIEAVYGHKTIENSDAETPNYILMNCYSSNPSDSI